MEEIKVGEYVRINNDFRLIALGIGKVTRINQDTIYVKMRFELPFAFKVDDIAKHRPNIIDLIEEGDYVNGKLIHKVDIRENSAYIYYGNGKTFCDYQIKDVVTKEQFNQMKYIVGDE